MLQKQIAYKSYKTYILCHERSIFGRHFQNSLCHYKQNIPKFGSSEYFDCTETILIPSIVLVICEMSENVFAW